MRVKTDGRVSLSNLPNRIGQGSTPTSVYRHMGINAERLERYGSGNITRKGFDDMIDGKYRKWTQKDYTHAYADYYKNMESARVNPRLKFYLDWVTNGKIIRRSPWQAEGERLIARLQLGSVINDDSNDPAFPWFVQTPDNGKHQLKITELQVLNTNITSSPHCKTFLFRDEVLKTALSMPLPKHTISTELLPIDMMFWVFEMPVPITIESADEKEQESIQRLSDVISDNGSSMTWVGPDGKEYPSNTALVDWVLIWAGDKKIHVTMSMRGVSNTINLQLLYEDGDVYESGAGDIPRLIFSIMAFINTPMVHKAKEDNPRRIRRQFDRLDKKSGSANNTNETSVVYLRRATEKTNGKNDGAEKTKRDFQWWVSGHYRSQWYSTSQTHKLIWIAPHLKGEKGMPVRDVTYMVVR